MFLPCFFEWVRGDYGNSMSLCRELFLLRCEGTTGADLKIKYNDDGAPRDKSACPNRTKPKSGICVR